MQQVFWTQRAKRLLHRCNPISHRCKRGFGWCKRLLGDFCSLGPKDLLHPPLATFGDFLVSGNFPGPWLPSPRGRTGGAKPGSGVQRFWGRLGASEFDPSFQYFGVSRKRRGLLEPRKGSQGLGGGSSGARRGVSVFKGGGKKVGHSEAPKSRGPVFPDAP